MIYISTALYCEAQPFIKYYNLKKDIMETRFQIFRNETIILIITKTGSMNGAIGVTYLCSGHIPGPSDLFFNIGVCAADHMDNPIGTIFLCNKIIDQVTNRSYYPDVLFAHSFLESSVITCSSIIHDIWEVKHKTDDKDIPYVSEIGQNVIRKEKGNYLQAKTSKGNTSLIDMEAAGIYQAASIFFQSHQLIFLKIISDYGTGDQVTPEQATELIQCNLETIAIWLDKIKVNFCVNQTVFSTEEEECINKIVTNLHCSVSMEHKLRQMFRYYKLSHGTFCERVSRFLESPNMPCKTKIEGKKYFEQLKSELI